MFALLNATHQISTGRWPKLHLSYHLLDASGCDVKRENARARLPYPVAIGKDATFLLTDHGPVEPGEYLLEWDMVSDGECWFADCGSKPLRTHLRVIDGAAPA